MTIGEAILSDGAWHEQRACSDEQLVAVEQAISHLPPDQAGIRLTKIEGLQALLGPTGAIGRLAVALLGEGALPVRAILFDKTIENNWALGWHQDRTIVVKERRDTKGFGPWTVKAGLCHVAPPFDLLEKLITVRLHLDSVDAGNAPLLVAIGSHRYGLVPEGQIAQVVGECPVMPCLASRGDAWVYATPILHASERAAKVSRRRVLQIDFCAQNLPNGLEWMGV